MFPLQKPPLVPGLGNLCPPLVSNAVRMRATSHPCECGAGLLEIYSNPQEIGAAKFVYTMQH